jgi:hypothetical protein
MAEILPASGLPIQNPQKKLAGWKIALIVIGVLAALAIAAGVTYSAVASRKSKPPRPSPEPPMPPGSLPPGPPVQPPVPVAGNVQVQGQPSALRVTAIAPASSLVTATGVFSESANMPCPATPPAGVNPDAQVRMSADPYSGGIPNSLAATIPTVKPMCVWVQSQERDTGFSAYVLGTPVSVAPFDGPPIAPPALPDQVTLSAARTNPTVLTINIIPANAGIPSDWQVLWYLNGNVVSSGQLAGRQVLQVASNPGATTMYQALVFSGTLGLEGGSRSTNTVILGPSPPTLPSALALQAVTGQPEPWPTRITPVITGGSDLARANAQWFVDGAKVSDSTLDNTPWLPVRTDGSTHLYRLVLSTALAPTTTVDAQLQYP